MVEYEYEYLLFEYYSNTELFAHLWAMCGHDDNGNGSQFFIGLSQFRSLRNIVG